MDRRGLESRVIATEQSTRQLLNQALRIQSDIDEAYSGTTVMNPTLSIHNTSCDDDDDYDDNYDNNNYYYDSVLSFASSLLDSLVTASHQALKSEQQQREQFRDHIRFSRLLY